MTSKVDLMGLGMAGMLADYEGFQPEAATAAGTATGTATVLAANASFVNVTTAGGADSLRLSSSMPYGRPVYIFNLSATTCNVFPPTSAAINGGATDGAVTIAQGKARMFIRYSATVLASILTA